MVKAVMPIHHSVTSAWSGMRVFICSNRLVCLTQRLDTYDIDRCSQSLDNLLDVIRLPRASDRASGGEGEVGD